MYGFVLSLTVLASAAVGALAADLKIDVTLPVECERRSQKGDKIQVHYRGTLQSTGAKFDASYDRGTPLGFTLGNGQVIKGWDQGLLDMCIGEKRTLTVPPEYGYGQRSIGPIPAGSTLIFETELVGIAGVPKPETIITKSATETSSSEPSEAAESAESATEDKAAEETSEVAETATEEAAPEETAEAVETAETTEAATEVSTEEPTGATETAAAKDDKAPEHNEL